MRGHNICFQCKIRKIIFEVSSIPHLELCAVKLIIFIINSITTYKLQEQQFTYLNLSVEICTDHSNKVKILRQTNALHSDEFNWQSNKHKLVRSLFLFIQCVSIHVYPGDPQYMVTDT